MLYYGLWPFWITARERLGARERNHRVFKYNTIPSTWCLYTLNRCTVNYKEEQWTNQCRSYYWVFCPPISPPPPLPLPLYHLRQRNKMSQRQSLMRPLMPWELAARAPASKQAKSATYKQTTLVVTKKRGIREGERGVKVRAHAQEMTTHTHIYTYHINMNE